MVACSRLTMRVVHIEVAHTLEADFHLRISAFCQPLGQAASNVQR